MMGNLNLDYKYGIFKKIGREYSPSRSPKANIDFITMKIGTIKSKKELK